MLPTLCLLAMSQICGGFVPLLVLSLPLPFNSHQPNSYLSFWPTLLPHRKHFSRSELSKKVKIIQFLICTSHIARIQSHLGMGARVGVAQVIGHFYHRSKALWTVLLWPSPSSSPAEKYPVPPPTPPAPPPSPCPIVLCNAPFAPACAKVIVYSSFSSTRSEVPRRRGLGLNSAS